MNFKFNDLSIAAKIWFPFSIFLIVIFGFIAIYYPKKQQALYEDKKISEMSELVKTVALGVELSMNNDDFIGLKKTMNLVSSKTDFEFISIILDEFEQPEVFLSYPENFDKTIILNPDQSNILYTDQVVNTTNFKGSIRLGISKKFIQQEIRKLNAPVYIVLFLALVCSLILFHFLAGYISKPISFVSSIAKELENGNFNVEITNSKGDNEVNQLNMALISLRDRLKEERTINEKLTNGLENEIQERTIELKKTTENLLQAQRVSKMGSFTYQIVSKEWECSEGLMKILGISLVKKGNFTSLLRVIPPSVFRELIAFYSSPENKSKLFESDFQTYLNEKNQQHWGFIICELVLDANGKPSSIQGSIQDITERKLIETEIERLSLVAQKTSNSVIITDINKKMIWVNDALCRLTGYSLEEIIGNSPKMFQFDKTDKKTIAYINNEIENHRPVTAELVNRGKHGNEYWLELNIVPLFDNSNTIYGYIAVETDITERKLAQEALSKSEDNYKKILDNAAEMIHTLDQEGNLIWANKSWLENMSVTSEYIKNRNISEFLSPETLEEFKEVMPQLAEGETVTDLNCRFLTPTKHPVYLIGKTLPIIENNEFIGSQAYLRNVTEIVLAENKLMKIRHFQNFLMGLSTKFLSLPVESFIPEIKKSLNELNTLMSFEGAAIYFATSESNAKLSAYHLENSGINFHESIPLRSHENRVLNSVEDHELIFYTNQSNEGYSILCLPLQASEKRIGEIVLVTKNNTKLTDDFIDLVKLFTQIITNTHERIDYLKELLNSKEEIEQINKTLEYTVLENTRKNIELSKTLVDQEKLATIGEISAGIAHDLNTPLGAIKVGAESIDYAINEFIQLDLTFLSAEELNALYQLAMSKPHSQFYGGLVLRKNQRQIVDLLNSTYGLNEDDSNELSELLVRCQINPDDIELIDKLVRADNRIKTINLFYHFQTIKSMMSTIQTSIQKSIQVVHDIKSFSRADFHDIKKNVNLKQNISTVLNVLKYELTKNIDLSIAIEDNLVIDGLEIKLFQLWSNLMKNAIDAMEDQEHKILSIESSVLDQEICISIKNNGPMIPLDIQDKIFRKFFSSKTKKNGTGLGLSIVQNVIDEHNARIELESNIEFTTFRVIFKRTSKNT